MKIQFKQPPTAFETNGLAVQYAPSKRDLPSWRWRVLVILVLAPLLIFFARVFYRAIFVTMPGFVTIDHTVIKTPLSGRLVHSAHVGDNVRAGEVIAQLRNEVLDSQLAALTTALAAARQRAGSMRDTSAHAARVAALRASALPLLRLRQQQYDNVRYLVDMRAATQRELDEAQVQLLQTRRDLAASTAVEARPLAVDAPEAEILVERITEAKAKVAALRLVAPQDGVVSQVFVKPGEWLVESTEIADVRAHGSPKIEVYVEPSWANEAKVGHLATINFLDGYSHRAKVAEVKMTAQRLPPDRANPLVVRHHSIIAMLDPVTPLPTRYRINILPVNVEFDLFDF
jgi:HlyD family secretion protein